MSRILGGFSRRAKFWLLVASIPTVALSFSTRSHLDEHTDDLENEAIATARANEARKEEILKAAKEFVSFADSGPSGSENTFSEFQGTNAKAVYHVVDTIKKNLEAKDFTEILEKDDWAGAIQPGGKYYVRRAGSSGNSIIAFAVGKKWQPGEPFSIVASHVDSPCLKLKPVSDRTTSGFRQVGVETYGGGLWHTWFDRDLGAAGRVFVRTTPTRIESRLIQLDEPILRVPSLASHMDRQNPFKFDLEQHLLPVVSQKEQEPDSKDNSVSNPASKERVWSENNYTMTESGYRHPQQMVSKIAEKLDVHPSDIVDFDLSLYDLQKATLGGANNEFIYSARIDNLMMTFCTMKGYLSSLATTTALEEERCVRTFVAFDHEEIGSTGPMSAQSTFLPSIIERLTGTKKPQSIARSLLLSADVIHAQHPNYAHHHDVNHKPLLNSGIVFSSTSRRSLAKSTPSVITLLESICKLSTDVDGTPRSKIESVPPKTQFYVFLNGGDCGSTVGPHLESNLGIRVVDLGNSTLSMHSIREMAGSLDVDNAIRFMRMFYENYSYFEEWVTAT